MKQIKTSKQLTFTYFSIVAFAIVAFHFSMLGSMIEGIERLYAENRMIKDAETAVDLLEGSHMTHVSIPPFSEAYVGKESMPAGIILQPDMDYGKSYELDDDSDTNLEMFSMRSKVIINGKPKDLYLIHYDAIYELTEKEMFGTQTTQLLLSLLLLAVSLWVVMRISERLTSPLSRLSKALESRSPTDISAIALPDGVTTREIHQLVDALNGYQQQIRELLDRERAFNRYASHELRTPLMVMKGVVTLLGKSDSKAFVERQCVRMSKACHEMEDYITALLSLTRDEDLSSIPLRTIEESELENIRQTHLGYLVDKSVAVEVVCESLAETKLPATTLHILIGNLLKNALSCTDNGKVEIYMTRDSIAVIDTGCGLSGKPGGESYGLGLMIVRDICAKYHCQFSLFDNDDIGCTAKVIFPSAKD